MVAKSRYRVNIPETDLLAYTLRHSSSNGQEGPLWLSADSPWISVTRSQALEWATRFASGLKRLGISKDDVVLVLSPNHVYIPIAFVSP